MNTAYDALSVRLERASQGLCPSDLLTDSDTRWMFLGVIESAEHDFEVGIHRKNRFHVGTTV